jgi:predicted ester cyclase
VIYRSVVAGRGRFLMSTEQNKEISLSLIEALNARDLGLWSRHLAEDYEAEHPGVSVLLDKSRSIAYHQRFVTAFPDIHFEVLGVIAEGDRVFVQWTGSGTHTERLATITGRTIPPTRRRVRVPGAMLTEVREGKITRGWFYWDQLTLLAQLALTEQPGLFLSAEGY